MHKHHADIRTASRQASVDRLRRGQTRTLVLPLFIERGHSRPASEAQAEYQATFAALTQGLTSASAELDLRTIVSFEGADGFASDHPAALAWVSRGACLWGLVHSRSNALGGASQDPDPGKRTLGLTAEGKTLAQTLITHGALLDAAHASDTTLENLAAIAEQHGAPLVDSHTGVRALANIPRNVSDAHIRRIAKTGGIVGVSLHTGHLSATSRKGTTLADYAAHIRHIKDLVGVAHVAIGSDLEGDITLPAGVDGAAVWPSLAALLRDAGWTDADLRALFHENAERVFAWSKAHGCVPQGLR
jgi:membrane dipeptidase